MPDSLRDVRIVKSYTSKESNLTVDFFNPVLSVSNKYYRVSAYYSSHSLKGISEGLSELLTHNGSVKMIVSFLVNPQDYDALIRGTKNPNDFISDNFLRDKNELKCLMQNKSVEAFASLVRSGKLQMRFVLSVEGLFHEKYGIMFDDHGDYVSFVGSLNETLDGLTINYEKIKVFRSWIEPEKEYISPDLEEFEKYWAGDAKDCIVKEMPDKVRNLISETQDEYIREQNAFNRYEPPLKYARRQYQEDALQAWIDNGFMGILEMATGTGKTYIAIKCMRRFIELNSPSIIVVAVPTDVLVSQWEREAINFPPDISVTTVSGDRAKSIDELYTVIKGLQVSQQGSLIIIGTYVMLATEKFRDVVLNSKIANKLLVADEVHHIAAEHYGHSMDERYTYRLGLSATPERYFDEDGSQRIFLFFGGVVYELSLKEAIDKSILSPYLYYQHYTSLTNEELEQYVRITKKLSKLAFRKTQKSRTSDGKEVKTAEPREILSIQRSRILKKAENKGPVLRDILSSLQSKKELTRTLIYFEDNEQIDQLEDILESLHIHCVKLDASRTPLERDQIIDKFSKGEINCLLAMKILDEGVDIPSVENAIIVASSGNPAQFIQRRGRLLRKSEGKTTAEIHDIIVLVGDSYRLGQFNEAEKNLMLKELHRARLFSESAENSDECLRDVLNISLKYNLGVNSG